VRLVQERNLKLLTSVLIAAALTGCAQLQAMHSDPSRPDSQAQGSSNKIVDFVIPPDALGARDPKLTDVLAKVGTVASKQSQPTTIVIAALAQDFPYLNQSVRRGIAPQRNGAVRLENVTVGSCQPYSVQIKSTE
jgi:hypothetical protein